MEPIIKFENIGYSVGNTPILDNISFEIEKGDFLSIVGPNGSGKTTLLKLILGIKPIPTGKISFDNSDKKLTVRKNKLNPRAVGYVPQVKTFDSTFPAIALELVANGINGRWNFNLSQELKNKSMETLEKIDAQHLAMKRLKELSGGELQRIYFARAIIGNPKILLLDEPATGIDYICEKNINEMITELSQTDKTTIIMITHDWASAYFHANKTLLLNKNLIYFGATSSAFTDENLEKTFLTFANHRKIKINFNIKEISF